MHRLPNLTILLTSPYHAPCESKLSICVSPASWQAVRLIIGIITPSLPQQHPKISFGHQRGTDNMTAVTLDNQSSELQKTIWLLLQKIAGPGWPHRRCILLTALFIYSKARSLFFVVAVAEGNGSGFLPETLNSLFSVQITLLHKRR